MTLHKKYVNGYLHIALLGQLPAGRPAHELLSKYEPLWKNIQTTHPHGQPIWAWRRDDVGQTTYMRAEHIVPACWIITYDDRDILQACFANTTKKVPWWKRWKKSDMRIEKEIKFFLGITDITELESALGDVEDLFLERKE